MPSTLTITSTDFTSFVTNTVIDPGEVNNNFSVQRGHLLPVDPTTSASADAAYQLGSTDYRWTEGHFSGTISAAEFKGNLAGTFAVGVTSVSSVYSASITDQIILCTNASTAAYTVTLPTPVGNKGKAISIEKTDDNIIDILLTSTSGTIDGTATSSIGTQYENLKVVSDGTNWVRKYRVVNHKMIESRSASSAAVGTASQWHDLTSILVPRGNWNLYGAYGVGAAGTITHIFEIFIGTVSGNDGTGLVEMHNHRRHSSRLFTGAHESIDIGEFEVSNTTATTYYLKYKIDGSTSLTYEGYKIYAKKAQS